MYIYTAVWSWKPTQEIPLISLCCVYVLPTHFGVTWHSLTPFSVYELFVSLCVCVCVCVCMCVWVSACARVHVVRHIHVVMSPNSSFCSYRQSQKVTTTESQWFLLLLKLIIMHSYTYMFICAKLFERLHIKLIFCCIFANVIMELFLRMLLPVYGYKR